MPMKLHIGAADYSLAVQTDKGQQTYDLSKLNRNQLDSVREMVVNFWARENGFQEPYEVAK